MDLWRETAMTANKMWGGRFETGPAAIMREITPSIDFDKRLAGEDLAGSQGACAHAGERRHHLQG